MSLEDAEIEFGAEWIELFLRKKIIKKSGDKIKIDFLDEQLQSIRDTSAQKSKAAKDRWNARALHKSTDAMHVHKSAMQKYADKTRQDKMYITIRPVYVNERPVRITDLAGYFQESGQYDALNEAGWNKWPEFMADNSGAIFNDPGHLYNAFRKFCLGYKPPDKPPEKRKYDAELWDFNNWTKEAFYERYAWKFESDHEFKAHFEGLYRERELRSGPTVEGHHEHKESY